MIGTLSDLTVEDVAKKAAGNWRSFQCFAWHRQRELADSENWAIFYTEHRDSGPLDQSNAAVIHRALERFAEGDDPDVVVETHGHWAVGHVNGLSLRVFRNCGITEAFTAYHKLQEGLADYPVLDDDDYSNREYEATLENITNVAWRVKNGYELTESWATDLYLWLSENNPRAIENLDDQGGCPNEQELVTAIESLGFKRKP